MYEVQCTKYEILWKYTRNRPSKLGEIRNSDTITTYFTERSEVYFYSISTVFLSNYFTERSEVCFYSISTVFLSNYFTERPARRGGYFNPISTVSRLPALGKYLVLSTSYNPLLLQQPRNVKPIKSTFLGEHLAVFNQFKVFACFARQKLLDLLLIFRRKYTAGSINQLASLFQHGGIALKNFLLGDLNLRDGFCRELPLRVWVSAQYPQSGARYIEE